LAAPKGGEEEGSGQNKPKRVPVNKAASKTPARSKFKRAQEDRQKT